MQAPSRLPFPHDDVAGSIGGRFAFVASQCAAHCAIATDTERVSYGELERRVHRIAAAIARHGNDARSPVAVLSRDPASMIAAMLATWHAGRLCVPLDASLPGARIDTIVRDAGPALVLTDRRSADPLDGLPVDRLLVDELGDRSDHAIPFGTTGGDGDAVLLYTSGSTGKPKGVLRSHACVLHRARCASTSLGIVPGHRVSALHSPAFGGGLRDVVSALLAGATLMPFDLRREGLPALAEWIDRERITVLCGVVSTLRQVLADGGRRFDSVRTVRFGSEPLYGRDVDAFRRSLRDDCVLVAGYGASEASGIVEFRIEPGTSLPPGRIPAGHALEGVDVLIVDDDGRPVRDGERGEVRVRSRYLASGYWRQPAWTSAAFLRDAQRDDLRIYRTGDVGRLRDDGCLEILGRRDRQAKVRGYLVHPGEIELALVAHDAVAEAAVTSFEGDAGEVRLAAYVVPSARAALTAAELRRHLASRLPAYMVPASLTFLDALPLNANGKLDRLALPRPARALDRDATAFVTPDNPTEHQIAAIWERLFDVAPIGRNDSFFDLGGDSLLAAAFVAELEATCGSAIPASLLLKASTVAAIAEAVVNAEAAGREPLTVLRANGAGTPVFFVHNDAGRGVYTHGLARCLDARHPFFAVHLNDLQSLPRPATLGAIAANRIAALRAARPHGPYVLGGHCTGGLVALEMARQLVANGEDVELVAMIDTRAPSHEKRWLTKAWKAIDASAHYYRARGSAAGDEAAFAASRRALRGAVRRFMAPRYDGRVVLFRAEGFPAPRPDLGWTGHLPCLDVVVVPGDHHTCITRHVATLGSRLADALARSGVAA